MEALRSDSWLRGATWIAAASVGAFLVLALAHAGEIADWLLRNSDNAIPLVFAEFFDDRGGGQVVLGNHLWLEPLYALHLTRWVPHHLLLWKLGPFLVYAATLIVLAWTVERAVSRQAGLLVALAMLAPAPVVLIMVGATNAHLNTLAHIVLLAGFLVAAPLIEARGRAAVAVWAVALVLTLVTGVASDILVVIGGVLPFVAVMAVGWRMGLARRETAILGISACVTAVVLGGVLRRLVEDAGIHDTGATFPYANAEQLFDNVRLLLENVALFAHGTLGRGPGPFGGTLEIVAVAAIVGVPVLAYFALRPIAAVLADTDRPVEQRLLYVFWAASLVLVALAFVLTTAPSGPTSVRYVLALWPALLVVSVIRFGRPALFAVALFAAGAAALGFVQLLKHEYGPQGFGAPSVGEIHKLERVAQANGVDHGYAPYWDAAAITAVSGFSVPTFAVEDCASADAERCRSQIGMDSWYRPASDVRTFYLYDPTAPDPGAGPPPPGWGKPLDTVRLGKMMVLVYGFDVAARLAG